jgi:hypothetical protein
MYLYYLHAPTFFFLVDLHGWYIDFLHFSFNQVIRALVFFTCYMNWNKIKIEKIMIFQY